MNGLVLAPLVLAGLNAAFVAAGPDPFRGATLVMAALACMALAARATAFMMAARAATVKLKRPDPGRISPRSGGQGGRAPWQGNRTQ